MTGSNSNIATTRQTGRSAANYGFKFYNGNSTVNSTIQAPMGFQMGDAQSGSVARHESTCILITPAKFRLYLDYHLTS